MIKIKNSNYDAIMRDVPSLKKLNIGDGGTGYSFIGYQTKAGIIPDPEIPYVAAVERFMAEEDVSHDNVIILSDEPKIARKAAALLAKKDYDSEAASGDEFDEFYDEFGVLEMEEEEDEYFDVDELEESGSDDPTQFDERLIFREIDISRKFDPPMIPGNPYHTLIQTSLFCTDNLLVTKLEVPDRREEKVEAIEAVMGTMIRRMMILLPTSEKDSVWVKDIIRENGFSVLELPDCTSYLKGLIKKDGVTMDPSDANKCYIQAKIDCGKFLDEETVARYVTDPRFKYNDKKPAFEELNSMIGLEDAKEAALELAAMLLEQELNPKLGTIRKSMVFLGNPGSGKTTVAELMTKILAETGNARNAFVTVSRSDLIGKYVGHTAPKVEAKFDEARGGVLFVDEAGFFLGTGSDHADQFASEAIKEFVRYMELYEDVTVIFAMYKDEVERFMNLDEGLASRVCRHVVFNDYTDKELIEIAHFMADKKGYKLAVKADVMITAYLNRLKRRAKCNYGNAREVRKLIETVIKKHAIKNYLKKATGKVSYTLSVTEVQEAIESLERDVTKPKQTLGFAAPSKCVQAG